MTRTERAPWGKKRTRSEAIASPVASRHRSNYKDNIIWSDSPAEKELRASGTDKSDIQQEMNGFLGRLARADLPNAPKQGIQEVSASQTRNFKQMSLSKHFAIEKSDQIAAEWSHSNSATSVPRPLFSSPKKREMGLIAKSSSHKSTEERWLNFLDLMERKYSELKGSVALASDQIETEALNVAKTAFKTPPKKNPTEKPAEKGFSPEFWSPLTEESWNMLDKLETQASQSRTQSSEAHTSIPGKDNCIDQLRGVVVDAQRDTINRQLQICLFDPLCDVTLDAVVAEDWYETDIRVGDPVNLIFLKTETGSNTSTYLSQTVDEEDITSQSPILINNNQNAIIIHPDIFVSPTSVTNGLECTRKAWVKETWRLSSATGAKALLGTLKHELFQTALLSKRYDRPFLSSQIHGILKKSYLELIDCNVREQEALSALEEAARELSDWLSRTMIPPGDSRGGSVSGVTVESSQGKCQLRVHEILATEEMIYSTKWGLKGALDATLLASFSTDYRVQRPNIVPLELKTGSRRYAEHEHQGQVLLYMLLLNERYGCGKSNFSDGALLYIPGLEALRIAAHPARLRGLIQARNKIAVAIFRATHRNSTQNESLVEFPRMLGRPSQCKRCFQAQECFLHHFLMENGSAQSSGADALFLRHTQHLTREDVRYFKHYMRLLELEEQYTQKRKSYMEWFHSIPTESCASALDSLVLMTDRYSQTRTESMRSLRFQRSSTFDTSLRIEDRVILSAESMDRSKRILHIGRGRISDLIVQDQSISLSLEILQPLPLSILRGESFIGSDFMWRIDLDTTQSNFSRAKENLIQLFLPGAFPKTAVPVGTRRQENVNDSREIGDYRRRELIVSLSAPRFAVSSFSACLEQVPRLDRAELQRDYERLNSDQRAAISKILSALDYCLILGMPGTGKTATIAFIVRVLACLNYSVLITSYTHAAVDHLLHKIVKGYGNDKRSQVSMIRIGRGDASNFSDPLVDPYRLTAQAMAKYSTQALQKRLKETLIVGATCLSIPHHVLFHQRRFDYCIVDEACQIMEPVVLGALRCADAFVLVGDPHQLPPLVRNPHARACDASNSGLDTTLFHRLFKAHPAAMVELTMQYRMNDDIMNLANKLVYEHRLICGSPSIASRRLRLHWKDADRRRQVQHLADMLEGTHGIAWINTDPLLASRVNLKVSSLKQIENVLEARIIVSLVIVILQAGRKKEDIAIVSPFKAQVLKIQQLLMKKPEIADVEVSTIDRYQGKDRNVILISFVKDNRGQIGELLNDWRRLNVALTRAKEKLILVGSMTLLTMEQGPLAKLLANVRNCEFSVDMRIWKEIETAETWFMTEPEPESAPECDTNLMVSIPASTDIEQLVETTITRKVRIFRR